MPTVSRCDCTQVDLTETVKITYDPDADAPFQTELTHVHVDFNACQGINNRNNDLWAYIAKLYYQGDVTNRQFGQAGRIITDNGCDEATSYKLLFGCLSGAWRVVLCTAVVVESVRRVGRPVGAVIGGDSRWRDWWGRYRRRPS